MSGILLAPGLVIETETNLPGPCTPRGQPDVERGGHSPVKGSVGTISPVSRPGFIGDLTAPPGEMRTRAKSSVSSAASEIQTSAFGLERTGHFFLLEDEGGTKTSG